VNCASASQPVVAAPRESADIHGPSDQRRSAETPLRDGRWLIVVLFAIAMAWVESAVVFYLRTMTDRIQPYQPNPIPDFKGFELAEIVRELATMIMLATVGWLAGRTTRSRIGYSLVAFGVWDIGYYVFLKILCGWPASLLDWDLLFLIPLPWWGPVLAPMLIAALMILWGTLASQFERNDWSGRSNKRTWFYCGLGIALGLYAFMADAIRVTGQGEAALRNLLPETFNWPVFIFALALMSAPVVGALLGVLRKPIAIESAQTA
jgi:hypothetical protein